GAAAEYARAIAPVFGQFAADLARWATACAALHRRGTLHDPFDVTVPDSTNPGALAGWTALDVGTGTGALAARLGGPARLAGVDLSPAMLRAGSGQLPLRVQADAHRLPFGRGVFHLACASFGLNLCDPRPALASLARVVRPGGLLIFQEWAALDAPGRIVDEALADVAPDDVPGHDGPIRDMLERESPWVARLQDAEDYYDALKAAGFSLAWAQEGVFATARLDSVEAFLGCKFAWPWRRLVLDALDPAARGALWAALRDALRPFARSDGGFDWSPPLFRACAVR
ncbi:MAG: methyltransferase domain-containing protein, partial [Anaerolineae bacterium]|nr:methyltransferase domain-containing protein [Anaerolineae bacterium]